MRPLKNHGSTLGSTQDPKQASASPLLANPFEKHAAFGCIAESSNGFLFRAHRTWQSETFLKCPVWVWPSLVRRMMLIFQWSAMQKLFEIESEVFFFCLGSIMLDCVQLPKFFQNHFQGGGVVLFGSCGSCEMTSCETICVWRFSCCDLFQDSAKSFLSNLEFVDRS